jgi:hypothetical protein
MADELLPSSPSIAPVELQCTPGQCASVLVGELRWLEWTKSLNESILDEFIHTARVGKFEAGESILQFGEQVTHAYFVVMTDYRNLLLDSP